jgi:translation initiation factor IF-3
MQDYGLRPNSNDEQSPQGKGIKEKARTVAEIKVIRTSVRVQEHDLNVKITKTYRNSLPRETGSKSPCVSRGREMALYG